jgi:hypothetical protein
MYSVELMIQARPNGRLLDICRIATGGSEILEAKFQLTGIISNAELEGVTAQFQFGARIYRPSFSRKQAQNARFHLIENERFGWFSRKTGSINSGTGDGI